jgi:hypothetical protein
MDLDSYTCDLCSLQKLESVAHLFLRCNFAKACWQAIGASVPTTRTVPQILNLIRQKLGVSFFMEIIFLVTWSIWTTRNDWMFNGIDPSVQLCLQKFTTEFSLLLLRIKPDKVPPMEVWLQTL